MKKLSDSHIDWRIIWKMTQGLADEHETALFGAWLNDDERHRVFYERVTRFYNNDGRRPEWGEKRVASAWTDFNKSHPVANTRGDYKKKKSSLRWSAAVAVALIAVSTIWFINNNTADSDNHIIARVVNDVILTLPDGSEVILDRTTENSYIAEQENVTILRENGRLIYEKSSNAVSPAPELRWGTIEVPHGVQFDLILEDGTQIWLNSGSMLRFPTKFVSNERLVFLEGEGYFKVAANTNKPFIVETEDQKLTVYGTEFNIYAYPGEPRVLTTLVSGSVGVRSKESDEQRMLEPGQQLQLDISTKQFSVKAVDAGNISSWRDGKFVFDRSTLDEVMTKLSR